MPPPNPTQRFSNRVADYVQYRPDYPPALLAYLTQHCGLTPEDVVADVGSGTGMLSRHFLENGNAVYGVEPNPDMGAAAVSLLENYAYFNPIDAPAEATQLLTDSVDWVVAGQAFHWFNRPVVRTEFERILKPGGWVALVWNDRLESDPFQQAYEQFLLAYATDYRHINHRHVTPAVLADFFSPNPMRMATFENSQIFDFEGLKGRLLSCSYAPTADDPTYAQMIAALRSLFNIHSRGGQLLFRYTTRLYYAQMAKNA
ncbi:MAG: methyltransferase domain-containing protein [Cyanobacteria bacterium P01_A01_bin.114]